MEDRQLLQKSCAFILNAWNLKHNAIVCFNGFNYLDNDI